MIKLFDRVVLNQDLADQKLQKGDVGTVVMIHDEGEGYEIEFFKLNGETYTVATLFRSDIRPVKGNEMTHVRALTTG